MDKNHYVITISRQFASMGRTIAQEMAEKLEINFYDRDIVEEAAKRMGEPVSLISDEEEMSKNKFFRRKYPLGMGIRDLKDEIFDVQANIIQDFASRESCIIVGRCANSVLKDFPNCLNVFIYAPYEARLKNCIELLQMEPRIARRMIKEVDRARENYRIYYSKNIQSPYDGYDVMIDSSRFGASTTADLLTALIQRKIVNQE